MGEVSAAYDRHTKSIHLQGIGRVHAKPAQEFKVGEKMGWNYGSTSKVIGVKKVTKKFIVFRLQTKDGSVWERRLKKDRMVAIG